MPSAAITSDSGLVIANGDPVYINGIATGQPQVGLQVWVIGNNFFQVSTISVNPDDSYSFELKPEITQNLAPGQYYVIIQDPMMNGQFDIVYDPTTGNIINRQLGNPPGTAIFHLTGSGSLRSSDSAAALIHAISSQYVDDTFVTSAFTVRPQNALINPVSDHAVGDNFMISGSTNLAVGDNLLIEMYSQSFGPQLKNQSEGFSGTSGTVKVVQGTGGLNRWSFDVNTSGWNPDTYIVIVSGVTNQVTGTTTFNLVQNLPVTTITTAPPVTTEAIVLRNSSTPAKPTSLPAPTPSPIPLPEIIGGLMIFLIIRQAKKKG
jgi:hypothetical protein